MRRLVKDRRRLALDRGPERGLALAALHGQKPAEIKRARVKAGADKRGDRGAGTWQHRVGEPLLRARAHEPRAGIGNRGRAGIGDERDIRPGTQTPEQLGRAHRSLCSW